MATIHAVKRDPVKHTRELDLYLFFLAEQTWGLKNGLKHDVPLSTQVVFSVTFPLQRNQTENPKKGTPIQGGPTSNELNNTQTSKGTTGPSSHLHNSVSKHLLRFGTTGSLLDGYGSMTREPCK